MPITINRLIINYTIEVNVGLFKCLIVTNLQYIPWNEYTNIFGEKLLRTEWNSSKQLVCSSGDACEIPFLRFFLVRKFCTFP